MPFGHKKRLETLVTRKIEEDQQPPAINIEGQQESRKAISFRDEIEKHLKIGNIYYFHVCYLLK